MAAAMHIMSMILYNQQASQGEGGAGVSGVPRPVVVMGPALVNGFVSPLSNILHSRDYFFLYEADYNKFDLLM